MPQSGDVVFNSNKIKILDGSFTFQLEKHTGKQIDGDPLWSARQLATDPDSVMKVHVDYLKAGSDIIETNTYQASIPGFVKYLNLSEKESYELIKKAVLLAKKAIEKCREEGIFEKDNRVPLIAGSVGPYGAYLHDGSEYSGKYIDSVPQETIEEYHRPKIQALIEGGVDLLAIETIPSKKEAKILVNLLKEFPNKKAWLSFSCKDDGVQTVHGDNFKEAALNCYELNKEQLIAVGVNCTSPAATIKLLSDIKKSQMPLIVYANSGEKYDPKVGWDNNPDDFEKYIPEWIDAGVKYLGGCCRVCDFYIAKIKEVVTNIEKC